MGDRYTWDLIPDTSWEQGLIKRTECIRGIMNEKIYTVNYRQSGSTICLHISISAYLWNDKDNLMQKFGSRKEMIDSIETKIYKMKKNRSLNANINSQRPKFELKFHRNTKLHNTHGTEPIWKHEGNTKWKRKNQQESHKHESMLLDIKIINNIDEPQVNEDNKNKNNKKPIENDDNKGQKNL
jgi:hypothetical protein